MIIAFSFLNLLKDNKYEEYIKEFNNMTSSDWIHFDVMDGNFVDNYTFDDKLVKKINEYNNLFSDVHLMINNPSKVLVNYQNINVKQITFHYETIKKEEIIPLIKKIKKMGFRAGVSIKPNTDIHVLDSYLSYLDYILIMSVEPGKGGQAFISGSLDKIRYLKKKQSNYHYLIGVDGGINDSTIKLVKDAGVDVAIVGSYLVNNFSKETLKKLKK